MLECPVIYYENNLIFDANKSCWGVFKMNGFDYDNIGEESKLDIHHKLTRLLSTIADEAKILIVPATVDLDAQYKALENSLDDTDRLYKYAIGHCRRTKKYLHERTRAAGVETNDYETYIIVKLVTADEASSGSGLQGVIDALIKDPVNWINTAMQTQKKDIMASKVARYRKLAAAFLAEQAKRIAMRPATATEVQYLLKRTTYKGIENDIRLNLTRKLFVDEEGNRREVLSDFSPFTLRAETAGKDTVIRPFFRDTVNLFKGEIDQSQKRMLQITHHDGATSYQTYMVVAHMPYEQDFPGNEWIYLFQNLNVQAEVCIHIKNIENRQALHELEAQNRKIKAQYENINEVGEETRDVVDSYQEAMALEDEMKASRPPIVKTCVSVCLFGKTPEEVEEKAEFVRTTYEDYHFVLERPISDQFKLFMQHIPGAGKYLDVFTMPLLPQTLAGGGFGMNSKLGNDVGPYIGTTGKLKKPVFFLMGLACKVNDSASAFIVGRLGKGKSFSANLLTLLNVFMGGYALIFDPKGERGDWPEKLPMLRGLINIVTLGPEIANHGKLDPFLVYEDDYAEASTLAYNVLCELFRLPQNSDETLILTEALEAMEREGKPCMQKLCEIIEGIQRKEEAENMKNAADRLARNIRSMKRRGMAALMFGTGKEKAIRLDNRLNIFQIQNLKLPEPETEKNDFTPEEAASVVLMTILGNVARKFAMKKRNVFSTILFDESWALGRTAEGIKLYNFLARMGRSLNCGCIFNGHSVLDIPSAGVRNAITYKFCFNTENTEEAERMLELLDMELTQDNIDVIKSLGNGECLFRDLDGRVGVLKFDAVFADIIEAFNTTPKSKQQADAQLAARQVIDLRQYLLEHPREPLEEEVV